MKSGILKQLLLEHNPKYVRVMCGDVRHTEMCTVVDAKFDTVSRTHIFLHIKENPHSKDNRTQIVKSFLLDFKDTHEVLLVDDDKMGKVYPISNDYQVVNDELLLMVQVTQKENMTGLLRGRR